MRRFLGGYLSVSVALIRWETMSEADFTTVEFVECLEERRTDLMVKVTLDIMEAFW